MIEFPIRYYEGNLVFSQDEECWAYYEIPGYNYDFLSDEEKDLEFRRLESFFWQINANLHLLILPDFQSIREKHDRFQETLSGPVVKAAIQHAEDSVSVLEQRHGHEGTEYRFYLGVQLPKPEKEAIHLFREIKAAFKEFFQTVHERIGIEGPEILEEDIQRQWKNEKRVFTKISNRLYGEPVDEETIQWMIRRNWYRGLGKAPVLHQWSPAYTVHVKEFEQGDTKVRRPIYRDLLRLTEGLIDESPGRSLKIKQMLEGEDKEGHVAFLILSNVPYEMLHPGDEWLYAIQSLDFPVEISIRTETMENRKALAAVRNKQMELKDQDRHAQETDHDTSLTVLEGRAESHELEAHLQRTRMPLLLTSIVLCVSAPTEEECKRRTDIVKDLFHDMMIQVEQPYGDQWLAFNEFLPGSKRYIDDYIHYMEPGTLAGGMFGATKQIGDGQGFYIGFTGILNQPVYITPNRAAQGIRGTKTNALSACFLGSLGGGKSFSSNLITYLSVLSGAKALIIDPKGERGNWKQDLKALEGHINIITLSTKEEDRGKLDPFSIFEDSKDAEALALNILTFFTGVQMNDSNRFPKLSKAVKQVADSDRPSLSAVVDVLLHSEDPESMHLGEHILAFQELSFARLLFGDGDRSRAIQFDTALNVLQIQDLELPAPETDPSQYTLAEMLSVAMMLPISSFALKFIQGDRSQFKIVLLDEAWAVLNTSQGRNLSSRLVRAGRSMNAGIYFVTQNANDLLNEKIKNNIGMKFAFRSTDPDEIRNVLKLFLEGYRV